MASPSYGCYFQVQPPTPDNNFHRQYARAGVDIVQLQIRLWNSEELAAVLPEGITVYDVKKTMDYEGGFISELSASLSDLGVPENSREFKLCMSEEVRRQEGQIWDIVHGFRCRHIPDKYHASLIALLMQLINANRLFPLKVVMNIVDHRSDSDIDEDEAEDRDSEEVEEAIALEEEEADSDEEEEAISLEEEEEAIVVNQDFITMNQAIVANQNFTVNQAFIDEYFTDEDEDDDIEDALDRSMEEFVAKTVPASEAAIASLEKVVKAGEVELCCAICMDGDELGFSCMPCTHMFHTECVETWLRISSSCPLCRYALIDAY